MRSHLLSSRLHAAIALTIWAIVSSPSRAATPGAATPPAGPVQARQRIGLALGGGSARGLAHVGVLQWLREHRIPIDAIAGTSMGGLIGGSYATGMTDGEIRTMLEGTDWDMVLSTEPPFPDKTFRRKEDRRAIPASLQFGVRRGLWLPRGLNQGQQVALLLDRLALPYTVLPRFDDLPTPFRCVAFDVNRSESVVLGDGVLSEAMRATMALPGIFPPVVINGRLLVDGGLQDNVPADVARQMDVDVVIAVDVGTDPSADTAETAFSMLSRAVDSVMAAGVKRSLESADVVIRPDLGSLSGLDWGDAKAFRERGYRAAERHAAELLRYAMGEADYEAHETARRARRRLAPIVASGIDVIGVGPAERDDIARRLARHVGRPIDVDRLTDDLLLVSGTDRYEVLTYHLAAEGGTVRLIVNAKPRPNGPAFLQLALDLNNIDSANFSMKVKGRTTVYGAAGRGSELRLDFTLGTPQAFAGELYRPLGVPWLFVAPRASASNSTRNHFVGGELVGEYRVFRAGVGTDVGVSFGRTAELRVGADLLRVDERRRVGDPLLPEASGWERLVGATFVIDTQDSPVVPSRGVYAKAQVRRIFETPGASSDPGTAASIESPTSFWQAQADLIGFHALTPRNRVFVRTGGGTSFDARPWFDDFSLGGPLRMSAFRNDELGGPHFAFVAAGYMRQLPHPPAWVGGHAYLAAWTELGTAFEKRSTATWHRDVAGGLVVDSLLGPVFVGGGVGRDGHRRLYVSLGPLFR
jgi:NTE family protein